jgi:hypothetical protein
MKAKLTHALLGVMWVALASSGALAANQKKAQKGGLIGNSYASQMDQVDDTTLRITTRKKVTGDLAEVNTPGTTTYNALQVVSTGSSVRAALEAKNLGYKVFQVVGVRSLSQNPERQTSNVSEASTTQRRNANADLGGGLSESAFTFAPGHYTTDVEIALEITIKLVPGEMPANAPNDYIDVEKVLKQVGLSE